MPSTRDQADQDAMRFVAVLGAAMASANYPVTMVRTVMEGTSRAYRLDSQFVALPNYVQVGSPTGEGVYIANPDTDLRYDQSFPLAKLVARAPSGTIDPAEGLAELDRIRHQERRFPAWVSVVGYAVQSTGLALILQPTPWSLLLVPGSLGFIGVTQLLGTHSSAVFTATLISMMSIALGVQTGILLWRAAIQVTGTPHRRAIHD